MPRSEATRAGSHFFFDFFDFLSSFFLSFFLLTLTSSNGPDSASANALVNEPLTGQVNVPLTPGA